MKGDPKVIECLNVLLADELTAISQYMVEAEMLDNWGLTKLSEMEEKRAITEMKHAEKLISRILFLEGRPTVTKLNEMRIGADVPQQFDNDLAAEMGAIRGYNAGIKLCVELGDNATRALLESILQDEDAHADEIETQKDRVAKMGMQVYLGMQI
ncbi:MAG: bacterioferritin [Sedimentisphaerales bacterium]|nr:bacterioferritin [Sedimentisphaerales bacterium]